MSPIIILFHFSKIFKDFKVSQDSEDVSLASSCPAHFILIIFDPTEALTNQAPKTTKNAFGFSKAEMGICCILHRTDQCWQNWGILGYI